MEQPQLILRPRRGHVEPTLVLVRGQGGEVLIGCDHHRQEDDVTLVALEVRRRAHPHAALFPLLDADAFDQLVANLVDLRLPLQHDDAERLAVVRGVGEAARTICSTMAMASVTVDERWRSFRSTVASRTYVCRSGGSRSAPNCRTGTSGESP